MSSPIERLEEHIGWVENKTEPYNPTPEDLRLAKALRAIIDRQRQLSVESKSSLYIDPERIKRHYKAEEISWVISLLADAVNPEEK